MDKLKAIFQAIKQHFHFRYDHTQCVIKAYSIHPSSGVAVKYYGKNPTLHPGKYQFSCKTPDGYLIKYVDIIETTNINIKSLILNSQLGRS